MVFFILILQKSKKVNSNSAVRKTISNFKYLPMTAFFQTSLNDFYSLFTFNFFTTFFRNTDLIVLSATENVPKSDS